MNKLILKAQSALCNKTAEMYVSKVVWTLSVIIVGMLLMWGLYALVDVVILPRLETNIETIFTNADNAAAVGHTKAYAPSTT